MSQQIGALGLLLLTLTNCQSETVFPNKTNAQIEATETRSISIAFNNLTYMVGKIESTTHRQHQIDSIIGEIVGDIEVLITGAMDQLREAFYGSNQMMVVHPDLKRFMY